MKKLIIFMFSVIFLGCVNSSKPESENIEIEKLNNKYEQQVESLELKIDSMSKSFKIINLQVLKHLKYEGVYFNGYERCEIYGDSVDYCEGRIRESYDGEDYWECWYESNLTFQIQDETGLLKLIYNSEGKVMEAESYSLKFEFEIINGDMTFLIGNKNEENRYYKERNEYEP